MSSVSEVFQQLDRELWVVTAAGRDGRRGGLIATFVNRASIVPELPRVLVGLARRHHTHALVESSGAFALHLIGVEQLDWVWRFGLHSGRTLDKLDGLEVRTEATGSPILTAAPAWLDCRVEDRLETGDRTVFLAAVVAGRLERPGPVLTAQQLMALAPEDRKRTLADQMASDAVADAAAIRAWCLRGIQPD
jgi:flavin reductase (DIM6/NTAB) family NADH-FMN oxidoreductase RutF